MKPRALPPLGDLEHELLTILWSGGEMTAASVRTRLARSLKDATVRTVLRRLEDKGYITHSVMAGTFVYRPVETAQSAAASALQGIMKKFCGGSIEVALLALADAARMEPAQLAAIAGKLKRKAR
jgi:predicted transcriptional regulator